MTDLLSMKGRMNRLQYFLHEIVLTGLTLIITTQIELSTDRYRTGNIQMALLFLFIGGIGLTAVYAFQTVKRLHDIDRPGTHYWLLLIPLYNIYLSALLHFKKGTEGPNAYGPDPLSKMEN